MRDDSTRINRREVVKIGVTTVAGLAVLLVLFSRLYQGATFNVAWVMGSAVVISCISFGISPSATMRRFRRWRAMKLWFALGHFFMHRARVLIDRNAEEAEADV